MQWVVSGVFQTPGVVAALRAGTRSSNVSHMRVRPVSTGAKQDTSFQTPPSQAGTSFNPIQGSAEAAGSSAAPGPSSYTSTSAVTVADYGSLVPRLVVFGGSGYVGTRVCEQALQMGADVVSVSRKGRPSGGCGTWASRVRWETGDALDPQQPWKDILRGAAGVVSTLGAFGSNELMYRVCGEANMTLMDAAAAAGVPRFAFISVHDFTFPFGWRAKEHLLRGYFQGKRDAETHLAKVFPQGGVALRPSFIYGSRHVGSIDLPLGLVGAPLAAVLKLLPTQKLVDVPIVGCAFVPPVSVNSVGKAAAAAALDLTVPPGIMDLWKIATYAA